MSTWFLIVYMHYRSPVFSVQKIGTYWECAAVRDAMRKVYVKWNGAKDAAEAIEITCVEVRP